MNSIIIFGLAIFFFGKHECKNYNNYTLFRGIPTNEDQLNFFKNLEIIYEVNYWKLPGSLYKPVDFTIAPDDKKRLISEAAKRDIYLKTVMEDVQEAFESQTVNAYVRRKMDTFGWRSFYRLGDIYNWLKDLQADHPDELQLMTIGTTYEGREIIAVRIALKGANLKRKVLIEGGIHAREWVSPAFVTYLIYHILMAEESKDKNLMKIAMSYEWLFVPIVNPDGYEYSHTEDRMWRKNRQPYGKHFGVDLNRNFGIAFGTVGISHIKETEVYCGPKAFSEKESLALANFVSTNSKNLMYYLSFHAFGQFMIVPYGYSTKHWDNYNQVYDMCTEANNAIKKRYGTSYSIGTAYDTVGYTVSGGSGCWVKKAFNVPIVVFFELRDQGKYGFALSPDLILPTCEETLDGLVSLLSARKVETLNQFSNNHSVGRGKDGTGVVRPGIVYLVLVVNILFAYIVVF